MIDNIVFGSEAKKIVTNSLDNSIKEWNAETGTLLFDSKINSEFEGLNFVAMNRDVFVSISSSSEVDVWSMTDYKRISSISDKLYNVENTRIDPSGKRVGFSLENNVKIYDQLTGRHIIDISINQRVEDFLFTVSGDTLIIVSPKGLPKLYSTKNGHLLDSLQFKIRKKFVFSPDTDPQFWNEELIGNGGGKITLSKDQRYLLLNSGLIYCWDLDNCTAVAKVGGFLNSIEKYDISSDDRYIAYDGPVINDKETIYVWDIIGDSLVCAHILKKNETLTAIKFSLQEEKIFFATSNDDGPERDMYGLIRGKGVKNYVKCLSFLKKNLQAEPISYSQTDTNGNFLGRVIDSSNSNMYQVGIIEKADSISFAIVNIFLDPKNIYMACTDFLGQCKVWELNNFNQLTDLRGHGKVIKSFSLSPDSIHLAIGLANGYLETIDLKQGVLENWKLVGNDEIRILKYNNDGRIIFATSDSFIYVINSFDLTIRRRIKCPGVVGNLIADSKAKNIVAIWGDDNFASFFSPDSINEKRLRSIETNYSSDFKFSSDGNYLVGIGYDPYFKKVVLLWNCITGERTLVNALNATETVFNVLFSPDSKCLLVASTNGKILRWDLKTNQKLDTFYHNSEIEAIYNVGFDIGDSAFFVHYFGDGEHFLIINYFNNNVIYKSKGGRFDVHEGLKYFMHSWNMLDLSYPDSIYAIKDGKYQSSFQGGIKRDEWQNFEIDDQFLIKTGDNVSINLFSFPSLKAIYRFIPIDTSDYLITTSEGRYDGSTNAINQISVVCGNEIIPLERVRKKAWEPNLGTKLFKENPKFISESLSDNNYCEYTPIVRTKSVSDSTWSFSILSRKGRVGEIYLYVGVKQVKAFTMTERKVSGNEIVVSITIDEIRDWLSPGENNDLSVQAYTADEKLLSNNCAVKFKYGGNVSSAINVYIISIGVSAFQNDSLRLRYASKDSKEFAKLISRFARNLFNEQDKSEHVFLKLINSDGDNENSPSKKNIRSAFEYVKGHANPNDIVLFFVSSHGVIGFDNMFYFLTGEAKSLEIRNEESSGGISGENLIQWLKEIRAQKQVLILDACHSGKFINEKATAKGEVSPATSQILQDLKTTTGVSILAASSTNELAYELTNYGRGILPFCLLMGIKDGNALLQNIFLDINKWFTYTVSNASMIARNHRVKQSPQLSLSTPIQIGKVDQYTKDSLKLINPKPIFRKSLFRNKKFDYPQDDKNLGDLLDSMLNEEMYKNEDCSFDFYSVVQLDSSFCLSGDYKETDKGIKVNVNLLHGVKSKVHRNFKISLVPLQRKKEMEHIITWINSELEATRKYLKK